MEKAKLMQLEIEKKRRLPKEVKNTISTIIFQNLLAAVVILGYFCAINVVYYNFENSKFEEYMKYFALGMIVLTVIVIEVAYRKNCIRLWVIGFEFFLSGVLSLYIPYIYIHTNSAFRIAIMLVPAMLVVYYLIKSLIIYKQRKFQYQNNLSDVKEIMKDEKRSYLDEKSTKTYRAKTEEEEEIKQVILKEQVIRRKRRQLEAQRQSINNTSSTVKVAKVKKVGKREKR